MKTDENGHPDVCRVEFSPISDKAKILAKHAKLATNGILNGISMEMANQTEPEVKRLMALARTKYEEACIWYVKAITSEDYK